MSDQSNELMCTLDDVLITPELRTRPSRAPDYEAEARALRLLAEELAVNPSRLLQKVVETVLDLCRADSAGVSILEPGGTGGIFRWHAVAGAFAQNLGGTMPREASPCGEVIARNDLLLFERPERYYRALRGVDPPIYESLLAPWEADGQPVGTLWAIGHSPERRFDGEDARLLSVLAGFAAAAWQTTNVLDAEKALRETVKRRHEERTLHALSTRLLSDAAHDVLYSDIVDGAMEIMGADAASLQIFDAEGKCLTLLASKGFHAESAAFWRRVDASSGSTCGEALRTHRRVVVADVDRCEFIENTQDQPEYHRSGLRAVQSTPLVSRTGRPVGMISTLWQQPHTPSERDLRVFDVLARQAADLIERSQAEDALRESEARLAAVFDVLPVGVGVIDAQGTLVLSNHEMRRYLPTGVIPSLDDACHARWRAYHPDGRRVERQDFPSIRALRGERVVPGLEMAYTQDDGREIWTRVASVPVSDDAGRISTVVSVVTDISQLRDKVHELRATNDELRATREQLSGELRRMVRLHDASTAMAESGDASTMLDEILKAALEATGADMGNVQLFQESTGVLTIAAHQGLERPFLDFFREVKAQTDSACRQALATRQRVVVEDVRTSPIFAGSESLAVLLTAGVQAVQSTPLLARSGRFVGLFSTHFRAPHVFGESELRWLDLLTRHAAELILRRQTDELLAQAHTELEQRVADRTKWLTLMHDVTRAINDAPSWQEGLHQVLRRICESGHWQIAFVYLPDRDDAAVIAPAISYCGDERLRPFHAASEHRRSMRGQNLPARVYAEGVPVWVDGPEELTTLLPLRGEMAKQVGLKAAAALPVRFGRDVIAVLELFSDQLHPPNEVLETLMNDVSAQIGKVLERERSTAQMADLVWREQQDLLHTLHDSLGQTLTGLGMLSAGLRQQLTGPNQAAADTARHLAEQAQVALDQVRRLSRGLFPVDVDPQGLLPSLRELASTTEGFHKLRVHVVGEMPASIRDARVATQVYRIAQEAVTNAVKHARATTISIELTEGDGVVTVRVRDDGIGIPDAMAKSEGLGLRIMRYRTASIGAQFRIDAAPGGGTAVVCTLRTSPTVTTREAPS